MPYRTLTYSIAMEQKNSTNLHDLVILSSAHYTLMLIILRHVQAFQQQHEF